MNRKKTQPPRETGIMNHPNVKKISECWEKGIVISYHVSIDAIMKLYVV